MYHFSCGALCETPGEYFYIFQGEMASFCHSHGPKQSRPSQLSTDRMCMICFDSCGETAGPGPGKLVSPCCGRTYHRDCVQKAALQAGKASLKCPACNNKETFNAEMVRCGLYIPHADAQWEMPEYSNFYQFDEMLNSDMRCDSLLCQCPDGPEFSRPGGRFEIVKCQTCGSRGVHVQCGNIDRRRKFFICSDCQPETSDSDTNSEGEELLVQERVEHHERFMKQKLAERDRLIEEELERLRPSQVLYTRDLQVLKSILSEPDPPAPPVLRWSRVGSKRSLSAAGPSRFQLIVPNGATEERINETMSILTEPDPPAPPVLRWSKVGSKKRLPAAAEQPPVEKKKKSLSEAEVLYPRELQVLKQGWRTMETQEERINENKSIQRWSGGGCKKSVSEDLQVLDQSSDQDQFPVIGNVCGGSEAKILSDAAVATEDSIEIFDDSDSDLEVIEQKLENS